MLNDTLDETKGFKYQITIKVEFKKKKMKLNLKNTKKLKLNFPLFVSIQQQRIINCKFGIDKSFQEISYRIDHWINEGLDCWINQVSIHFNL